MSVVVILWLNGRSRRNVWERSEKTTIRFLSALDAERNAVKSGCATLVITGAFNGPAHTERIVESLRQASSDVFVLDYVFLVFHPFEAIRALYKALVEKDDAKRSDDNNAYQVVALIGASLGGLLSLLFVAHDRHSGGRFRDSLCVIGCDSPLLAEHLLVPGTRRPVPVRFARWLTGLRPGPVWNWLVSFVMPMGFREVPLHEHSAGTDTDQWNRHMAFLRRTELSLFLSQTAAIVYQQPLNPADYADIPCGYLQCSQDDVIDAEASLAEWKRLAPDLLVVTVPHSGHVQFVEYDIEWQTAIVGMWGELIGRVIRAKHDALNG